MLLCCPTAGRADSADVTVPVSVAFQVTDISATTTGDPNPARVSFTDAVLAAGNGLTISVKANAADFTTPGSGTAIPASKLSWIIAGASNGSGSPGTLDSGAFTTVYQGNADATSGYVDLGWRLAAPPAGVRAGNHTLTITWKFESIGL
ncbi:MAG: hypothetical protein ACYC7E_05645 [Armatimonadota bacterium]